MTKKIRDKILICSSPLQVLNAQSAIDTNDENSKNEKYIIIFHPLLTADSIRYIERIAKKLNFKNIINIVSEMQKMENELKAIEKKFGIKNYFNRLNKIYSIQEKYLKIVKNRISSINSGLADIYLRKNYKNMDSLIISLFKNPKIYLIDDGWGDYLPKNWFLTHFNYYELRVTVTMFFKKKIISLLLLLFKKRYLKKRQPFFFTSHKINGSYSIVKDVKTYDIRRQFFQNLKLLKSKNNTYSNFNVLILGTTIDKRLKYSITDETKIYNQLIRKIKLKFNTSSDKILYKPHPRIDSDDWNYKKQNLNCKIVDFENDDISECFLTKSGLKAVFSFGSSSLFHSHLLNIPSYLVYFKHKERHQSDNEKYLAIARKFKLKIMYIDSGEYMTQ